MQSGTGDGRGRHRNRRSRETREFEQLARRPDSVLNLPEPETNRHGIPKLPGPAPDAKDTEPEFEPAPECPPWLRPEEYEALVELRKGLA